jgi:hypothetical protein
LVREAIVRRHLKKGIDKTMKPENHFAPNIKYLSQGNQRQREAYEVLVEIRMFEILKEYTPILVGTIPIDIDIPESDLDIICEVYEFKKFEEVIEQSFQDMNEFGLSFKTVNDIPRIVCNFHYKGWMIEVFGQPVPTIQQNGYKHMIIENRILKICGNKGNEIIRDLKKAGLKTEPAFGKLLNLGGNPYEILLDMYSWGDQKLMEYMRVNSVDVV